MFRDTDVQELLDRSRMTDTIQAFCDHCDLGDVAAVVDLFTEDGYMDVGGGAVHRGRAELTDMFTDRFSLYSASSFHCSSVRVVRYDGVTASTTTHVYAFHEAAGMGQQMHLWGRYEDELVNQSGTWRIRKRRLLVSGISHLPSSRVPRRFSQVRHNRPAPEEAAPAPVVGDFGRAARGADLSTHRS